jgi:UDP-3-O-[3-hydroxymyristoyl] N-acetylglucosamine deacetylase
LKQVTIKETINGVGIGLHKGIPIKITLEPLEADRGVVFYRTDIDEYIEANPDNVIDTRMATVVGTAKDKFVSTIEHLLSAIYAFGIDNILIKLDSYEVPIMDGSSASFCMMLKDAGVQKLKKGRKAIILKEKVIVKKDDKYVSLEPALTPSYDFSIDFNHPSISYQSYSFAFSKSNYLDEIARARTFGFVKDIQMLRKNDLALGGSLENAIVLDEKRILNLEGLRYENEFVRHKILDAIGDLTLLGYPYIASYKSHAGSHDLNHELTKKLLANPDSYEIVELEGIKEMVFYDQY